MKDGSEHKAFLSKPKGDPENPLSFDELTTKYRHAAKLALSEEAIERLVGEVKQLETAQTMSDIVQLAMKA
jgi:2-methylcitrate dehydratase PrpD